MPKIKTSDGFIWNVISDEAAKVQFKKGKEVFILYPDGSDSLVMDIEDALAQVRRDRSLRLALEVGFDQKDSLLVNAHH